jgi:hypothetical protein
VPIYVQDEHQNAQPRWLEYAAASGIHDFVLVHIDAHSDLAVPSDFSRSRATRFQQPINRETIRTSNDEFIQDAIYSEILSAVTWVVPDWGQPNEYDLFEGAWNNRWLALSASGSAPSPSLSLSLSLPSPSLPSNSLVPSLWPQPALLALRSR